MDYNYVENLIREDIKNKCPQLTNEIIEEYLDLTFWGANWVTYGDNKDLYILGIAEGKYDFYYVGCDNDYNIQLISCALSIKKNKDRDRDYIPSFESDFKEWSKKSNKLWKQITKNVKKYFKDNPQDKLLYFVRSSIFSEE